MEEKGRYIAQWNYDDLDNDIDELNRNLLKLNQSKINEAQRTLDKLNVPKKRKRNLLKDIFKP